MGRSEENARMTAGSMSLTPASLPVLRALDAAVTGGTGTG